MEIRKALESFVKVAKQAKKISDTMVCMGMNDNVFFSIYAEIADGIYNLIGEETDTFDESVTCNAINIFADPISVNRLMAEYERNKSSEPKS